MDTYNTHTTHHTPHTSCSSLAAPQATGLYRPEWEHDSCGVAFIANMHGKRSHTIVDQGLQILENLAHRGAVGAEENTGDGVGIMMHIPDEFYRSVVDFELPPVGSYATGLAFLPQARQHAFDAQRGVAQIAEELGITVLGWRDVPINDSAIGAMARDAMPTIRQVFVAADGLSGKDLERKIWVLRKRAEHELDYRASRQGLAETVYFPSLSTSTMVYKGMLTETQLKNFYPDLRDQRITSGIAIVHSRFSTNTFPAWPLAQPFRYIAHNGEINTVRGNRNWMHARELLMHSDLIPELQQALPIISETGSDTASFDEILELLHLGGRSLPHAALMMIPEAWEHNEEMDPARRAFYRYHSCLMEAWDGPASLLFTDGSLIGALLDRNGLRPSRYWITDDDTLIMASEAGVLPVAPEHVICKNRLRPGRLFLLDTEKGVILDDNEVKDALAHEHPYEEWLAANLHPISDLPQAEFEYMPHDRAVLRQRVFGFTREDCNVVIGPMAETGAEAITSMGTDTPLASLSERPRLLFDFFSQRFAQVTNPPLDAIREEMVTSLGTTLGPEGNILNPGPNNIQQIALPRPIINNQEFATLVHCNDNGDYPTFQPVIISGLYPVAHGGDGLRSALERVKRETSQAISEGARLIILSDRESNERYAPIPSLLLTSAVHQHLIREKTRTKIGLVIETGDAREVHHFAALFAFGAGVINPYMAFETIDEMVKGHDIETDYDTAIENFLHAAEHGVLKVMSKMGISTLFSYKGSQLFDCTGISQEVLDDYFAGMASPIGGITLDDIARDVADRHRRAFPPRPEAFAHRELDTGGEYKYRRTGEYHLFNPESIYTLQQSTRTRDYDMFRRYTRLIDDQSTNLATLRGLFTLDSGRQPLPIDEVEPVSSIVKRFSTGAMSYGSISAEAHECLAIAMNRLGARSNSGEGGEDPRRYVRDANGDDRHSAIHQVASGRFGTTSHYLTNCSDIQIKMAQGAKPGEGGQLPAHKVYPQIAKTRGSTPGVGLISPPPHHDIYSIEDLTQLIHDCKSANPRARIHVKLVAEQGVGTVAAGVAKAHADVVLISGHDGGTGAAPLNSVKHAGGPWELGLAETQQTLLLNGLRDRVVVQVDGQLKTGRDVIIAALLGAEEYGFATTALVVSGCVMMRACQKDTCPVGVATQNPELRARFTGKPEYVVNFMEFIAQEVREYLAELGFRTLEELIGHSEILGTIRARDHYRHAGNLDFTKVFQHVESPFMFQDERCTKKQLHGLEKALDRQLIPIAQDVLDGKSSTVTMHYPVSNVDRTVGTQLGHELTLRYGEAGLPDDSIDITLHGSAGNSLGAFVPRGITLRIMGDINDYAGKGLSGGRIVARPDENIHPDFDPHTNVIAGNVVGYGATSGEIFLRGRAGERFCVRNSGATAVVEGIGDHGCEYMTGGTVVVLGPVGRNFAAGMSGGRAFLYDPAEESRAQVNTDTVTIRALSSDEETALYDIVSRYAEETDSQLAHELLADWESALASFVTVISPAYEHIMATIKEAEAAGEDPDAAVVEVMARG